MESHPENSSLQCHKLLILSPYPINPDSINRLKVGFPGLNIVAHQQPFELPDPFANVDEEEWKDVTMVMTGSALPLLSVAPNLKLVQLCNAGVNHVADSQFFKETEIPFCNAGGVAGPQIAEWVISTFLAFQHNLFEYRAYQGLERWEKLPDKDHKDAVGQTVGILGYGSIGRQVARVSKALGMTVHVYTYRPRNTPESRFDDSYAPAGLGDVYGVLPDSWSSGDLHQFLATTSLDLLVIALPLTEKTRHLIGGKEFAIMAESRTFVVNIARGQIVITDDLIKALNSGAIRGAALDVTDPEPLPEGHPLWKAKNVIITPHCAGTSAVYPERLMEVLEINLERFRKNQQLINLVDRKEGY